MLANAFSFNMVPESLESFTVSARKIAPIDVPADAKSVIGHQDTARIVGAMLGREVPYNRESVTLSPGQVFYVAQYRGPRLPAGATELPAGATITFYRVELSA